MSSRTSRSYALRGNALPGRSASVLFTSCGCPFTRMVTLAVLALLAASAALAGGPAAPGGVKPSKPEKTRELYVPFPDLHVLLENQPRRVLLPREEYEALLRRAKKAPVPPAPAPHSTVLVSADYTASADTQQARLTGTLAIDVLQDGLHVVPLDLGGVGMLSAKLDGNDAPMGRSAGGQLSVLVEGMGRHTLVLEMMAPLETTAARQVMSFRLPRAAAGRLRLTVPGDVEIKGGAAVQARTVDRAARVTQFELLPPAGDTTIAMSLNSHLERREQAVAARCVLVDEVTEAYEKLHATLTLAVLHRAADRFRFVVPDGFEITEITCPLLARWGVEKEGQSRIAQVQLREPTTETVVLCIGAIKAPVDLKQPWHAPALEVRDVVGQVTVVGLLLEQGWKPESLEAKDLIEIDSTALGQALPATLLRPEAGSRTLRAVAAYYAPQSRFRLSAKFGKPRSQLAVTTNLLLIAQDSGCQVSGGFALMPETEKCFGFSFSVPPGWHVTSVTGPGEKPLGVERYLAAGGGGRVRVQLPEGIPPGRPHCLNFQATYVPPGWLGSWDKLDMEFPTFAVTDAARDSGAVAVVANDDLTVRPEALERISPLADAEKATYRLEKLATNLAYRYDEPSYKLRLAFERTAPRTTARTFSFFQVKPEGLAAHYELVYRVDQARTRRLGLVLPAAASEALKICGLGDAQVKEYRSTLDGKRRRWSVLLAEGRRDEIRLAVDFQQPLPAGEPKKLALPIVEADDVVYQSGMVAVEGAADLDVQVTTDARRVDVGQLASAEHQPGRRLLGAFAFVGPPPTVNLDVSRHPAHAMAAAIIERAELTTTLGADGASQTEARFKLQTQARYLVLQLPPDAELWSAELGDDVSSEGPRRGVPLKPQREGDSLLLGLPAGQPGVARELQLVYAAPMPKVGMIGTARIRSPKLLLRAGRGAGTVEVPLVNVVWRLRVPAGYEVVRTGGTLTTNDVHRPPPGPLALAGAIYEWSGGMRQSHAHLSGDDRQQEGRQRIEFSLSDYEGAEGSLPEPKSGRERTTATATATAKAFEAPPPEPTQILGLSAEPEPPEPAPPPEMPAEPEAPPKAGEAGRVEITDGSASTASSGGATAYTINKPTYDKRLQGVRSLKIDVQAAPADQIRTVTFESLGAEPELVVTLAHRSRFDALGWGLALVLALLGMAMTNRPLRAKVKLVLGVVIVAAVLPLVWDSVEIAWICNILFFAACLLVAYYLLAGAVKWAAARLRRVMSRETAVAAAGIVVLIAACGFTLSAWAGGPTETPLPAPPPAPTPSPTAPPTEGAAIAEAAGDAPPAPVHVPDDANILPYDPQSPSPTGGADKLLVPMERYLELRKLASPDKKAEPPAAPLPYVLAGASYSTTLQGDESLTVAGQISIDVYSNDYVTVPLKLSGGVLARAELDGKPAQLRTEEANAVVLHLAGKGRHKLDLEVRLRLVRQGGWRVAEGAVPSAPAGKLAVRLPNAQTELRLNHSADRRSLETQKAGETIETPLGSDGQLNLQWRPKVAEGQVDRGLTVQASAVVDVEEDGVRAAWKLALEFRGAPRDHFTLNVPGDYFVEKVLGANVRGWEVRKGEKEQTVEVSLLNPAKGREELTVRLWRRAGTAPGESGAMEFDAPLVAVRDAGLASGQVIVRRSPLLDLRTLASEGAMRIDLPSAGSDAASGTEGSVLPLRPHEAYRFAAMPFSLRLSARPTVTKIAAEVRSTVKLLEHAPSMDAQVVLHLQDRLLYRVELLVPEDLTRPVVSAPGDFHWSISEGIPRVLTVYWTSGRQGDVNILFSGELKPAAAGHKFILPRIEVRGAARQEGEMVLRADPAYDVETRAENCEEIPLARVHTWLDPNLQEQARKALHYGRPDYRGTCWLVRRKTDVTCDTITNVRVADRTVENTVMLNFTITGAGARELCFLLPAEMEDSRISVPMLRQKTPERAPGGDKTRVRFRLELQSDMTGKLRVIVQNDRARTPGLQRVPLPVVETGRTNRQYVVLQGASRDELVPGPIKGLDRLSPQQQQWQSLRAEMGSGITQVYLLSADVRAAELQFQMVSHEDVQTAKARIDLARTVLVLDANGAYRAQVTLSVDNSTEQFLDVELPQDAELWAVQVAGEPAKPTRVPDGSEAQVRVPILKTAPGDLNYKVVLKYGGKLGALGRVSSLSFPLARVKNLGVEQSLVELHVPESHRWFDFGGTMHLATEQAAAEAETGVLMKQTQRLLDTTAQADPFAKERARGNLERLQPELEKALVAPTRRKAGGQSPQGVATVIAGTLENVREKVKELGNEQVANADAEDNRVRMNALYSSQTYKTGTGVLALSGNNTYTGGTTVNGGTLEVPTFDRDPQLDAAPAGNAINNDWLAANGMITSVPRLPQGNADLRSVTNAGAGTLTLDVPRFAGSNLGKYGGLPAPNTGILPDASYGSGDGSGTKVVDAFGRLAGVPTTTTGPAMTADALPGAGITTTGPTLDLGSGTLGFPSLTDSVKAAPRHADTIAIQGVTASTSNGNAQLTVDVGGQLAPEVAQGSLKARLEGKSSALGNAATPQVDDQLQDLQNFRSRILPGKGALTANAPARVATSGGNEQPAAGGKDASGPSAPPVTTPDVSLGAPSVSAGLASLDFQLPTRGRVIRFTALRGETELTARAVSKDLLGKLLYAAGLAAVALITCGVVAAAGRGRLAWLKRPVGAVLLVALGLVSMIAGVLPMAGLVAFLTGLVLAAWCVLRPRLGRCGSRNVAGTRRVP